MYVLSITHRTPTMAVTSTLVPNLEEATEQIVKVLGHEDDSITNELKNYSFYTCCEKDEILIAVIMPVEKGADINRALDTRNRDLELTVLHAQAYARVQR